MRLGVEADIRQRRGEEGVGRGVRDGVWNDELVGVRMMLAGR